MYQQNRWTLCWAVVLSGFAIGAEAQNFAPRPKFGTWNPPAASSTGHYGILGEVARPGVYSAEGREVTLQELVQNAGGLTEMAGPAVRLVRQQRVAQGKFFDPNGRDVIQSGDMVLIDSRRPQKPGLSPVTHIGLLGVATQPVIVPVKPEQAQLSTLIRALEQTPELARTVRFIMPSRIPVPSSTTAPLPSGTVLLLDPRTLVTASLPAFPEATPMTFAAAVPTPTPFVDSSLAVPPPANAPLPDRIADARLPVVPLGRNGGTIDVTPLPFTNGDKRPQVNDTSLPVPGSRLNPTPIEVPQPVVTKPKATVPLLNENSEIIPDLDDLGIDEEEPSAATASTPVGLTPWYLLGIVGTVASLVGIAVLSRTATGTGTKPVAKSFIDNDVVPASIRKRSAMPTAGPPRPHHRFDMPEPMPTAPTPATIAKAAPNIAKIAEPVPAQEPHDLHEILAMRGPIETEAVVLPHGLKLRHAGLKPSPIYRADEPAMLPGAPHERPLAPTTPQRSLDTIVREKVPAPHFLSAPAPSANPPAPITIAEMVGGTAIERALHQLQQGKLS